MLNDACDKTNSKEHGVVVFINRDVINTPSIIPQKCVNRQSLTVTTEKQACIPDAIILWCYWSVTFSTVTTQSGAMQVNNISRKGFSWPTPTPALTVAFAAWLLLDKRQTTTRHLHWKSILVLILLSSSASWLLMIPLFAFVVSLCYAVLLKGKCTLTILYGLSSTCRSLYYLVNIF